MAKSKKQKPTKARHSQQREDSDEPSNRDTPLSLVATSMSQPRARFLIASLGNPGPLANTRHSAGHILLSALASTLQIPLPTRNSPLPTSPYAPRYTLFQSPSLMNVSGPPLLSAYRRFILDSSRGDPDTTVGLFVLHDDLEGALGTVKVRRGKASHGGHNGVKSVFESLRGAGLTDKGNGVVRVGVGIGRPTGRTRDDVVPYVMAKVSSQERREIEGCGGELVKLLEDEAGKIEKG